MKSTGFWLLLALFAIQAYANVYKGGAADLHYRAKRDAVLEREWITDEQKEVLEGLRDEPEQFHDKYIEFYMQLPQEIRDDWDKYYKKICVSWIKQVATKEEINEIRQLFEEKDREAIMKKIYTYRERLSEFGRKMAELFEPECLELWKDEWSRKRRDLDKNFDEFTKWMTEDQRKTISEMKDSGKSDDDLRTKAKEYFEALPADKQADLKEEFKEKCKAFFKKISKPEEMDKMKTLHEAGNDDEVRTIVKGVIGRLTGDEKILAGKMEVLCHDVFTAKTKRRRDIDEKINRRLSWMTADQKEQIKNMHASGKSHADIRAKIFEFLSELDGPAGIAAREQTQKECYKWMNDVATEEEVAALHEMHERDHDGCKKRVREFITRLPDDRRAEVEKNLPFCEKVWYGDHDHGHDHHHGHHRRQIAVRRRRHLKAIDKYLDWLTPEQKNTLVDIEKSGAEFDSVIAKVKEFYGKLSEDKKTELKTNFKSQCSAWVKEVATPEEMEKIKEMHKNKEHAELKKKLAELENRLTEEQKHTVEHVREVCLGVWEIQNSRRRREQHEHNLNEEMKKYLSWLTPEQMTQVKEKFEKDGREPGYKMIMDLYESSTGEVKTKAQEELKAACRHFGKEILGEKNVDTIKELKDGGATHEEIAKRVEEMVAEMSDPEKKERAQKYAAGCRKIYGAARRRRGQEYFTLEKVLDNYLTWLTDAQKEELKSLKAAGNKEKIYDKVLSYLDAASGEQRKKAIEDLQSGCKHYIRNVVGDEKADEFKQMKESGVSADEIAKKIEALLDGLTNEEVKSQAKKAAPVCKAVYSAAKRFRREHHEHKLDEDMKKYLTWLTADQMQKIEEKFENEGREPGYNLIMETFEASSGETKEKATKELKSACKHFGRKVLGDKNADIIKEMRETGATNEAVTKKIEEMIAEISDPIKKERAEKISAGCKKIYANSRRRRGQEFYTLEKVLENYLTWLNDDQKAELKKLKEAGNKDEIYKKIVSFLDAASGDQKKKAIEDVQTGCKHYIRNIVGDEKADEFKQMRESGVSPDEIGKKIEALVEGLTNEEVKAQAKKAKIICLAAFSAPKRFRRGQELYTLEKVLENYLTWLDEDQKAELKKLKEAGNKDEIYKKIVSFLDAASGDQKKKAIEDVQTGCKHYIRNIVGDEKADEFKQMRESGVSPDEIGKKIEALVEGLTNEEVKAQAKKAKIICLAAFSAPKRFRRGQELYTLEKVLENYLTWLDEDQKAELKKLKEAGNKDEIYKKIVSFLDAASGDQKKKAIEDVQTGCKHYIRNIVGDEKADEFKQMRESGVSPDEIGKKIEALVEGLTNEEVKAQAKKAKIICLAAFSAPKRFRRGQELYTLEKVLENYLTWLDEDQKAELKKLKEAGNKDEIYKKIVSFLDAASGDQKKKAIEDVQTGCKHYIRNIVGDEKADEFKQMRESGVSPDEIGKKIEALVEGLTNEEVKAQAKKAKIICLAAFSAPKRFRRGQELYTLEKVLENYLTWLDEDQKAELKKLKEAGNKDEIYKKIVSFLDAASGDQKKKAIEDVQTGCKHYIRNIVGDEKADEFKQMRESGVSPDEIGKKIEALVEGLTNEEVKAQAKKAKIICLAAFSAPKRFRRGQELYTLEKVLENYLTWLDEDQKAELKKLKEAGNKDEIYKKIVSFLDAASGDQKKKAIEDVQTGCKHYIRNIVGDEKADEFKQMRESGVSPDEIGKKIEALVEGLTNEEVKAQAKKAKIICLAAFSAPKRFRRGQELYTLEKVLENYLTWLDEDQKAELKKLKEAGNKDEIYKKIVSFLDAASGDQKKKAIEDVQTGCKHYIRNIVGDEKADEFKQMRESGVSPDEIGKKIEALVEGLTNEEVKAQAKKAKIICLAAFSAPKRFRRGQELYTLEKVLENYLTWLDEDQKAELKKLKEAGNKDEIYKKIVSFLDAASGDQKKKAIEDVQTGCKHYIRNIVGDEKADEFKQMRESGVSPDEIGKKIEALVEGLTNEEVKAQAKKAKIICLAAFSAPKRFRRGQELYTLEKVLENYLTWLDEDQKAELKKLKEAGNKDEIYKKIVSFLDAASGDQKKKAIEDVQTGCKHYIRNIVGDEKADEFKQMRESGVSPDEISKKIDALVEELTNEEVKTQAKKAKVICLAAFTAPKRFRRGQELYTLEKVLENYLTWLDEDQKAELKKLKEAGNKDEIYKKIVSFLDAASGDQKKKAIEDVQTGCKHYIRNIVGDEKADEFKQMRESGVSPDEIGKKIEALVEGLTNEEVKAQAKKAKIICLAAFSAPKRFRRGQELYTLEKVLENYLTWLDEDQKAELKKLKEAGNKDEIYKKIVSFLDAASGDQKKKAIEDVQTGCKHYIRNIVGDEKADEFKQMRESGVSPDEISKKIDALVEELTNEEVKTQAKKAKVICLAAFTAPKRFRRGQELYTLEKVLENYLTWLDEDQKVELKKLKEAGNKDEIYKKIVSFLDAASGDQKKKAIEDVQTGCKHYIRNIVGDEKADEFKQMRESGVSPDEIGKKIEALVEGLTNEEVKAQAKKAKIICLAAFSAPKRFRRGQELYTLEKVLENYLTWLDEDQKAELKKLKEAGNKDEIYKKIVSFLDAASGDQKKKAIEDVQTGCKHYIRNIVGDEKADEFKQMRESGVSPDEISKKIDALVEELTNEEVKTQAKKAKVICLAAFTAPKRFRRGQELYTLEKVLENYLTWLDEDQKAELKKLKEAGNKDEIYKKIVSFLDAASGDQKKKAIEDVQTGCKHYIRNIVGDEKADEFKQMRESGVSPDEIGKKIEALVEGLTNEEVKAQAKKAKIICLAAFTAPKRFRRERHEHTFAEAMENYLSWLSDDQKIEMKQLHEAGDKGALYEKVMEMFDSATGETKEEAASKLKDACRHYVKDLIGNGNADRIHAMKESGATNDEIANKVEEIIEEISDDEKKEHALRASKYCKKIYNVARRMRRDHHEHDVEEALEKYLTWLSADQKDEVKKMYESGKREEIYGKVMEYYNQVGEDVKEKATSQLKDACRHYIGEAIGKENKEKVEKMKEDGVTNKEIAAKVGEFISAIADEKKRAQAERANNLCKKIYGVAQRKRRDENEHHHDLEEALKKYLTWMNDDQKAEVKKTLKGGDRLAAYKKVMEYFEATSGETKQKAASELKAACKHYIKELIGEEKSAKITHMKESGASNEAIAQEVDAIISLIPNEKKRVQAQHAAADCKKIFNIAKRMRRELHEHTLEEGFQKYLTWLSDGQKDELRKLEANKDREGIFKKIMEYFEGATGEVKSKATEELKEGCKHHITTYIGKEKADELKKLKDSGATDAEMAKKVDEVIETITDEEVKAKAKKAAAGCRKIFGVTKARRHLAARRFRKSYKSYLSAGLFF